MQNAGDSSSQLKKPLILIIDDDPFNLTVVSTLLIRAGWDVISSITGSEGFAAALSQLPDLILLDVMLPDINGYDICKRLKAHQSTSLIPVIFLTGKAETTEVVKGFKAGGVDYVTKPFIADELLARVETHLKLRHAYAEIHTLKNLLPICAYCKRIRNDQDYWEQIEEYVKRQTGTDFSHGICPNCLERMRAELRQQKTTQSSVTNDD